MLKIGLTGGIGSGKTTVAKIFQTLGVPVYFADDAARHIMNSDPALRTQLIGHFGEKVYNNDGLDRAFLSHIVFNDAGKLALLNSLVHPRTIAHSQNWFAEQQTPYAIKEAALLFETDAWMELDKIIGVTAPQDLRIQRVMTRDSIDREKVLARMAKQMNEEEKMQRCDFVIVNNDEDAVLPQVVEIHRRLQLLAN